LLSSTQACSSPPSSNSCTRPHRSANSTGRRSHAPHQTRANAGRTEQPTEPAPGQTADWASRGVRVAGRR
jgi:hypothetical protein